MKENVMNSNPRDYSAFEKLKLERKPVGIKFQALKPEGVARINKKRAFCEMFLEAQESGPFYVQEDDFICVEPLLLGMKDPEPALVSGTAGGTAGLFKEARANRKIYQYIPKMLKGSVNYVVFSPVDRLIFDPDVVVITANIDQARTILRSEGYTSGDSWLSRGTPVMACSWLYIYPVTSGRINFTVTGLSLGMQALNVPLPQGLFLISIPWNRVSTVLENLQDANLYRSWRSSGREEHFNKFNNRLTQLRQEMFQ
jgi:uncharacterized protein (DUF169 family)